MSSTNRAKGGYVRQEDDFYETPAWCVELLRPHLAPTIRSVLDPCSGRGAILDAFQDLENGTYGLEINDERGMICGKKHEMGIRDALDEDPWPACDAIITNPPFFLALEFIQRAMRESRSYSCTLAFLLRLNFLGSKKRRQFHLDHPADLYVMTKRPSFIGGKTDSIEYAWFVWDRDTVGGHWHLI